MESWALIVIIIGVLVIAIAAIVVSLFLYMRHRKTKQRLADAEALYGAKQAADNLKKSKGKNWKQRLITRKTIR